MMCGGCRVERDYIHLHAAATHRIHDNTRRGALPVQLLSSFSHVCHSSTSNTRDDPLSSCCCSGLTFHTLSLLSPCENPLWGILSFLLAIPSITARFRGPGALAGRDKFSFLLICVALEGKIWMQCQAQSQTVGILLQQQFPRARILSGPCQKPSLVGTAHCEKTTTIRSFGSQSALHRDSHGQPLWAAVTYRADNKEYARGFQSVWHRDGKCDDVR